MTNYLVKLFIKNYENIEEIEVRSNYGILAGIVGIVCNIFLFAAKLLIGIIVNSISIMADAVNNLSDAASSIVSLVGVHMARKPADEEHPFGHGRIETRKCSVYNNLEYIERRNDWEQLKTIIKIDSTRTQKTTGVTTIETRYYISNIEAKADKFNEWIRRHWAIENNLHWNLDVIFGEDYSRKRQGNAAQNFNTVLKIALTMLTKDKSWKVSNKRKRNRAALNIRYREKLMNF